MSKHTIKNPILPGFYPDPSICRVGDDFYMICSSFEMYPGIPVFHSKDLANWEQLGYAMTKENGFHVEANVVAGGVMAPTIRYFDGVYYIINANFGDKGNFIVTATDPAGPWSEPYWLDDVPGIDASLFFDDDKKAYVIGTGNVVARADGTMDRGIWICGFDVKTMKTVGEPKAIWDSALRVATSPEAPHIYKVDGYYYLVIAEGGTEHYHAVTVARSKELFGWYEGNPANPVMTHRQFGFNYPVDNIGHADLVETPDGNWYAVMLGSRIIDGQHKNLGRETYICPVIWERGWPVFSPESGKVDWEYPADPQLPWTPYSPQPSRDDFDGARLNLVWNFWGTPYGDFYKLSDSHLTLRCFKRTMSDPLKPLFGQEKNTDPENTVSFVGRRQTDISFDAFCEMAFLPKDKEAAGLIIMQASNHQYRLERGVKDGRQVLRLVLETADFEVPPHVPGFTYEMSRKVLACVDYAEASVILGVKARRQNYDFYYGAKADDLHCLYENADARLINPEIVGGMVGTMVGMFATGNGTMSENEAAFDWFDYKDK